MSKLESINVSGPRGHMEPNSNLGLVMTLVFTSIFLYFLLPNGFITGTSSYWLSESSDITQYISGFNAYFNSLWRWPILLFDAFNYPSGTRATFVDIIPIYALALKVIVPDSFFPFNPFGYWVAFCYLMQGVSAWWILKELKINSWLCLLALTVFFVLSPSLMARMGHISLMSHWLLLFSFALYLKSTRTGVVSFKLSMLLLFCAFYINVYLFVMSLCIYFASIFYFLNRDNIVKSITFIISPVLIVVSSMFVTLLPLPVTGVSAGGGFGIYSMNILSPILGGSLLRVNATTMMGQGEGFNYLGLGVLMLFSTSLFLDGKNNFRCFRGHKAMFTLLTLFTLYSLSNQVYFGNFHLVSLPYPHYLDSLTSQFRASGRFFWPVGYAIVIYSIVVISKLHDTKKLIGTSIILLCTAFHIVDLKGRLEVFIDIVSQDYIPIIDPLHVEAATGSGVRQIYFYPKFGCPTQSSPYTTLLPLMKYASERNIKLNTGYIARYKASCTDIPTEISLAINDSAAFVFSYDDYSSIESIERLFPKGLKVTCVLESKMHICRPDTQ